MKSTLLVRLAISFIFIVFGIWEILVPAYWAPFVPKFVITVFNPAFAARIHGLILLVLGVLILISFRKRIVSALSSTVMLGVVFSVFAFQGFTDLLVRDIAIFLCSLSLLFETESPKDKNL